jgi:putative endonuclease
MRTAVAPDLRRKAERRGRWAEAYCVLRLRLAGWRVLARRATGGRGTGAGELDLVARRGRVLAFIEVKARDSRDAGLYAVTPQQQQRIVRAAEAFRARHAELCALDVRFDVMVVGPGLAFHHLSDAWRPL